MIQIDFDRNLPPETREAIAPLLERWIHLAPTWCHTIYVDFSGDDERGTCLSTNVRAEYRNATVFVHPNWLLGLPHEREREVVHEILHLALHPMAVLLHDLLERLVDDESVFHGWVLEEWRRKIEEAVSDLTHAVYVGREEPR